jgi:hypothetical protein
MTTPTTPTLADRLREIGKSALEGYPSELSDGDARNLLQAAEALDRAGDVGALTRIIFAEHFHDLAARVVSRFILGEG